MRYFAVMNDNSIKTVTNVTKQKSTAGTGIVYFDVDDKMFRYLTFIDDYESLRRKRVLIPAYRIQQFIHEDWYESRQVECLLSLDEEENEELNYFQSTDFNAGMLYSAIEKKTVAMLKETNEQSTSGAYHIPNIQITPKGCGCVDDSKVIEATIKSATEHFNAVYGKSLELDIYAWQRVKQYCVFFYRITRKEVYKEMTVADIEKALGYKIKVVGSRDAD